MADSPLARQENFGNETITNALWPQIAGVEDARGDIIAAAENLRLPEHRYHEAVDSLGDRRQDLARALEGLGLVGRAISFTEGRARATRSLSMYLKDCEDLNGVEGTIIGTQAGGHVSPPEKVEEDQLVLEVLEKGRLWPPRLPRKHKIVTDEAAFTIGPDPDFDPEDAEPNHLPKVESSSDMAIN